MAEHPSLLHLDHRPWPLPRRPWFLQQRWNDLLFLHWPVPVATMLPLLPPALQIDQFDGTAWVAVTPFWMSHMGVHGLPPIPRYRMPEINVRTYVTDGHRPGVWFLSLDAASRIAVLGARRLYHLPYVFSRMSVQPEASAVCYRSTRPSGVTFAANYQPRGPVFRAEQGTFDHWSSERYCLYSTAPGSRLCTADIHHEPWRLREATVAIQQNDLLVAHHLLPDGPMAPPRYAEPLDVVIWPLRRGSSPAGDGALS